MPISHGGIYFTYDISGNVGTANATVFYNGPISGMVRANGQGNYVITGLIPGLYLVQPAQSGFTFSPLNQQVVITGVNAPNVNFTPTSPQSVEIRSVYVIPKRRPKGLR